MEGNALLFFARIVQHDQNFPKLDDGMHHENYWNKYGATKNNTVLSNKLTLLEALLKKGKTIRNSRHKLLFIFHH